jgi:AcrR family transcriptional regulator
MPFRVVSWNVMIDEASPVQPVAQDGRWRIILAAQPLFVEHGYNSVSMQQIATASGIHKATLYHYFRDKDELFLAVVRKEMDRIRSDLEQAIEQGGTAREQLVELGARAFQGSRADFARLMSDVHQHLPESARADLQSSQAFPWEAIEGIFVQATERGELPEVDSSLATTMFTGLLWAQGWMRKLGRPGPPLTRELAEVMVDVLLAGLQHSPAALRSDSENARV